MTAAATRAPLTFSSPRVAADVALLVVLAPIAAAALTLLFLIPLSLVAVIFRIEKAAPFVWTAVIAAVLVLLVAARRRLFWHLTLDTDALAVGSWWPIRIPYARVVYLSVGAATDPMTAIGKSRQPVVPFVFGTGLFAGRRIFLRPHEADRCLREMYARCENAAGLDSHAEVLPPRHPGAPRAAAYRVAETLAMRALIALSLAALAVATLFLPHEPGNAAYWRIQLMVLPSAPALVGYGAHCLRRMRQVLRRGEQ